MSIVHKLHNFTEAFRESLPTELRYNTYDFVLDDETAEDLANLEDDCTLDFASMDQIVAREILGHFYATTTHEIASYDLSSYLQRDHLNLGIRACDTTLSSLNISFNLASIGGSSAQEYLRSILSPCQKWTDSFTLHIIIHLPSSDRTLAIPATVSATLQALQALKLSVVEARAKSAQATVRITLDEQGSAGKPPLWSGAYTTYEECPEEDFRDMLSRRMEERIPVCERCGKRGHHDSPLSLDDEEGNTILRDEHPY